MIYLFSKTQAGTIVSGQVAFRTFDTKSAEQQQLINQALHILDSLGVPIKDKSPRRLERMALAFLAICNVSETNNWNHAKSLEDNFSLKTREIIAYINQNFDENISRGSYDDIRRKDLKHLALAEIAIHALPNSARNDPNRAWAINPTFIESIRAYGTSGWETQLQTLLDGYVTLRDKLSTKRDIPKIPITLPSGLELVFSLGEHNQLQKAIIEEFLPRYGYGARVIYLGDTENKFLHYDEVAATEIGLLKLAHAELPDVIAYSSNKNWLYLIEAVHSSGAMSPERIATLQPFLKSCSADVIYMTAFLNRATFRKFVADIAWETEVWIATDPDHVIHFNGDKFLGPYSAS